MHKSHSNRVISFKSYKYMAFFLIPGHCIWQPFLVSSQPIFNFLEPCIWLWLSPCQTAWRGAAKLPGEMQPNYQDRCSQTAWRGAAKLPGGLQPHCLAIDATSCKSWQDWFRQISPHSDFHWNLMPKYRMNRLNSISLDWLCTFCLVYMMYLCCLLRSIY